VDHGLDVGGSGASCRNRVLMALAWVPFLARPAISMGLRLRVPALRHEHEQPPRVPGTSRTRKMASVTSFTWPFSVGSGAIKSDLDSFAIKSCTPEHFPFHRSRPQPLLRSPCCQNATRPSWAERQHNARAWACHRGGAGTCSRCGPGRVTLNRLREELLPKLHLGR
jgi:hypothetical protein